MCCCQYKRPWHCNKDVPETADDQFWAKCDAWLNEKSSPSHHPNYIYLCGEIIIFSMWGVFSMWAVNTTPLWIPATLQFMALSVCTTLHLLPGAFYLLMCMNSVGAGQENWSSPCLLPVRRCSLLCQRGLEWPMTHRPHFHVFTLCTGDVSCWCVHWLPSICSIHIASDTLLYCF